MASTVIQIVALIPGIVFLGMGLKRIFSKVMQWIRLLISGRSSGVYMGKRLSLLDFFTGVLSASVGLGWILLYFYMGV